MEIRSLLLAVHLPLLMSACIFFGRGGGRYLGMVRSQSSESCDLAWSEEEPVRFRVQVAGGDRCTSSLLTGAPDETVRLDIQEPLIQSSPSCR